jgi:hypothetical protein
LVDGSVAVSFMTFDPGSRPTVTSKLPSGIGVDWWVLGQVRHGDPRIRLRDALHGDREVGVAGDVAGRIGDAQLGRAREGHELVADPRSQAADEHGQDRRHDDARGEDERAGSTAGEGRGGGASLGFSTVGSRGLEAVEVDEVLRVEPEVGAVVAEKALRVDRAGQVAIVAILEGREVSLADLRLSFDARQVDALRLTSGAEHLPELVDLVRHSSSSPSGA